MNAKDQGETSTPIPTPDSGSADELKEKHLTIKCPQHNLKITSVVRLPDSSQQFLCKLCKNKGSSEKTFYLADILDDDFIDALMEKIELQAKDTEGIDEKHNQFFQFLEKKFQELQKELEETLTEAKEKLKKKYLAYSKDKKKKSTNWGAIKENFEAKKLAFLETTPSTPSEHLDKFLESYTTVLDSLQTNIEEKDTKDYQFNDDEIPRFLKNVKTQTDILSDKLLQFNFTHLNVQIDSIKEETYINTGHKGVFKGLTVMEDLNMFATGSIDGELGLWDAYSLTPIIKFKAHKTHISALLYVPSKKVLITASLDRTVKVFEVSDKKINSENPVVLTGHKSFIYGLCYLEDQNKFVSVGHEPEIKVWNLDTLKLDYVISTNGWSSDSYEIAYIREENWIALVGKDVVKIYNYETKTLAHEIKTGGLSMQSIQYLRKQKALVAAVEKGKIRVWVIEGGSIRQQRDITFEGVGDTPYTILAMEDQNVLAVTTRSKFICFVNFMDGSMVKKGTQLKDGVAVTVLKKQGKMIVTDNGSEKVAVFTI